jgi:hypothetical protein
MSHVDSNGYTVTKLKEEMHEQTEQEDEKQQNYGRRPQKGQYIIKP